MRLRKKTGYDKHTKIIDNDQLSRWLDIKIVLPHPAYSPEQLKPTIEYG